MPGSQRLAAQWLMPLRAYVDEMKEHAGTQAVRWTFTDVTYGSAVQEPSPAELAVLIDGNEAGADRRIESDQCPSCTPNSRPGALRPGSILAMTRDPPRR